MGDEAPPKRLEPAQESEGPAIPGAPPPPPPDEESPNGAPEPDEESPGAAPGPRRSRFTETLLRVVPAIDSLRSYSLRAGRADLIAGLTVAAVAVPQAMAYASIFGVPVEYGLYTAIVMTAVGALFDSSKQLINGPTNAISIALLSALAMVPDDQKLPAAVLMALMVGVIQTGISLMRLGDLSRFISHAVIVGFTLGAGVLLVLDQFKNLLGLKSAEQLGGELTDPFLKRFWLSLIQGWPAHGWTAALGLGTIALVLGLRWLNARLQSTRLRVRVPEFLVAVIVTAAVVGVFHLDERGVKVIGKIPSALPSFQVPPLDWARIRELAGSATAIGILGLLEAIAMAKSIASQTGQRLDINQQALSEGLANLSGSFFQCFPGSGSLTRSAINHQAGAATQWSGVISAAAVAVTMLVLGRFAQFVPKAALAGILIVSAFRMVDRSQLVYHLRATRFDAGILLATAVSAVVVSVEFCIMIGTFLSFVFYVPRAARVHLTSLALTPERVIRKRVPTDPPCDRLLLYSIEGELFFGSAPSVEKMLATIESRATAETRVIVVRLQQAHNPDASCLALFERFLDHMQTRNIPLILCGVRHDMAKVLHNTGLERRLGPGRIFREDTAAWSSTLEAVRHAYEIVGPHRCDTCPRRSERTGPGSDWYYMI